jgi:hypothetical protein
MSDLYLNDDEIVHITGKRYGSAQRKALIKMGYDVKNRPDGSFWVPRGQFLADQPKPKAKPEKSYHVNLGALANACS